MRTPVTYRGTVIKIEERRHPSHGRYKFVARWQKGEELAESGFVETPVEARKLAKRQIDLFQTLD